MKIYCWLLLAVTGSVIADRSCIGKNSATAALGHPFILAFNYGGPNDFVDYLVSKNGVTFGGDNTRVFLNLDRIYFTEVTELDTGTYTLEVYRSETIYNETVKLCGK